MSNLDAVQPVALRDAAEAASRAMHARRNAGFAALGAAAAAIAVGLAALATGGRKIFRPG